MRLEQGTQTLEGWAREIDARGNLVLELDDGTFQSIHAGTLRLANGHYA